MTNPMSEAHHAHLLALMGDYTENAHQRRILEDWARKMRGELDRGTRPDYRDHNWTTYLAKVVVNGLAYNDWPWARALRDSRER